MTDLVRTLTIGQNFLHEGVQYARLPEMNLRIGGAVTWANCARVCPVAVPAPGIPRGFEPHRILCEYLHPDTHVEVVGTDELEGSRAYLQRHGKVFPLSTESRFTKQGDATKTAEDGTSEPTVPAESFLGTLHANVDNLALDDRAFREFVRNSLPIVIYPRPGRRGSEDASAAPR